MQEKRMEKNLLWDPRQPHGSPSFWSGMVKKS
jgi:hypothetical protein